VTADPTPKKPADAVKLWRVDIERTSRQTVYVLAPNDTTAEHDAENFVLRRLDFWDYDDHFYAEEVEDPDGPMYQDEPIWTGGKDGEDIEFKDLEKWLRVKALPPEIPGQMKLVEP
jgi:hypothetical protein